MKSARIFLGVAALLLALVAWWHWPETNVPTPKTVTTNNASRVQPVVEAPKAAATRAEESPFSTPANLPTVVNAGNATLLASDRQQSLDGLLQFQTALQQSLDSTSDPQDRAALEHELAELQTQIQFDIGPSNNLPMVATNLGEITLVEGRPVQEKLASGDNATLTAATLADGRWNINVTVRHTDAGGHTTDESTFVAVQPGQTAVVTSTSTGNEIHFVPKLAHSAGASP